MRQIGDWLIKPEMNAGYRSRLQTRRRGKTDVIRQGFGQNAR